jgi:hypothetical protein
MVSAKKWTAYWEDESTPAKMGDVRKMILVAPGLPAGAEVRFEVTELLNTGTPVACKDFEKPSDDRQVEQEFKDWFSFDRRPRDVNRLIAKFPEIAFRFTVTAGGRVTQSNTLEYVDWLDTQVIFAEDKLPFEKAACRILTPWGIVAQNATSEGRVVVKRLAPGGCRVTVGDAYRTTGNT